MILKDSVPPQVQEDIKGWSEPVNPGSPGNGRWKGGGSGGSGEEEEEDDMERKWSGRTQRVLNAAARVVTGTWKFDGGLG